MAKSEKNCYRQKNLSTEAGPKRQLGNAHWKSVYTRLHRWSLQSVWKYVFGELIAQDIVDESTLMLDSTAVKIHQHGGAKRGEEALGRSRGGGRRVGKSTAASAVSLLAAIFVWII